MTAKKVLALAFLAFSLLSTMASGQSSRYGRFSFVADVDEFDGRDTSFVYTESKTDSSRDAALIWRCLADGLNILYRWDKYLGGDSDNEVRVRYRIDGSEPVGPQYWGLMQSRKSGHAPMNLVQTLSAEAKAGKELLIEVVDPLDGERLTDRFSLIGLSEALKRLSCAAT